MFGEIEYEVLEELKFGDPKNPGTWLRLEQSPKGNRVVRMWSGAGKNRYWKVMHRYNVEEQWNRWKRTCQRTH
jgi:hypothetical protein